MVTFSNSLGFSGRYIKAGNIVTVIIPVNYNRVKDVKTLTLDVLPDFVDREKIVSPVAWSTRTLRNGSTEYHFVYRTSDWAGVI